MTEATLDRPAAREMVRAEREEIRDLLASLSEEEWNAPSLCEGWRVRDVIAHLVGNNEAGLIAFVGAGMSIERFNAKQVDRRRQLTPAELLAAVERNIELAGAVKSLHPVQVLADTLIHHQDIRRPLQRPRAVPSERIIPVLAGLVVSDRILPGRSRVEGLALRATDCGFEHGEGVELSGPAEAILMAVAGRASALDDLQGEGVALLRERLSAPASAEGQRGR